MPMVGQLACFHCAVVFTNGVSQVLLNDFSRFVVAQHRFLEILGQVRGRLISSYREWVSKVAAIGR